MPRPIFVEFDGSPTSGKSTVIKELYNLLKRSGFKVLMPQEGAEVIPHTERDGPVYNIRTALYALQIFLRLREGHEYDFVLFDRCIFDSYVWMLYWHDKKALTAEDMLLYQNFFLSPLWANDMDAVFCLTCDPKVSMDRENKIALSEKVGETTNIKNLEKLVQYNKQMYTDLHFHFPQLKLVDTTHLSKEKMVQQIAEDLLDIVSK